MRRKDSGKQRSLERGDAVRSPPSSVFSVNKLREELPASLRAGSLEEPHGTGGALCGSLWWVHALALCPPSEQQRLLVIPATHVPPHPTHLCDSSEFLHLHLISLASPRLLPHLGDALCTLSFGTITTTLPLSSLQDAVNTPFPPSSQVCLHCHLYLWSLDKDIGKRILSKWVHLPERSLELAGF